MAFMLWIIMLIGVAINASREVIFYDYLADKDVSTQYISTIPITRYLIEPIVGLALTFDGWTIAFLPSFILMMLILRIGWFVLKKSGYLKSEKAKLLWYPVKDWIRFWHSYC